MTPEEHCKFKSLKASVETWNTELGPILLSPATVLDLITRVEKLSEALEHINDFCLCERDRSGFDYGEIHPHMGKPKQGSRWLTPRDIAEQALAKYGVDKELG